MNNPFTSSPAEPYGEISRATIYRDGQHAAHVYGDSHKEAEARARVMAAAPELRASLADCAESMRVLIASHGLNPKDNETYAHARALLDSLD